MSIPILEAYKKRKWTTPKVFSFHSFAHRGCPIAPIGPFRDNVRSFLRECAEPESYNVKGMPVWCTFLADENRGILVPLYTIEEGVMHSASPLCDHCRCSGWKNHFVSKRRYHLIIPMDSEWDKPLEDGVFDLQTHLLHGLIHCNGYGHLLCINGFEGGSKYLSGTLVMDLWDRICTILRARKITVEDVSKKHSMDLRLLHGVAYGHTWFGRWGYRFHRGSFGVSRHKYEMALDFLSSLELQKIVEDFDRYLDLKQIICYYHDLSSSQLITVRDLLKFMLTLLTKSPPSALSLKPLCKTKPRTKPKTKSTRCSKSISNWASSLDSRWPVRRLEYAANVIADALKEKRLQYATCKPGNDGMTRQEARDAARLHIGDTGLIDYVLKSLNNVAVGDVIVRRSVNPFTRTLEFSIQELGDDLEAKEKAAVSTTKPDDDDDVVVPGLNIDNDLRFLYENVLLNYTDSELVRLAAQAVLNSKLFVKEWPFLDENDYLLRFLCKMKPVFLSDEYRVPPGEILILPLYASIGDLKAEAQAAMRDTYCITEKVIITDVEGKEGTGDDEVLFGLIESGSEVTVRGIGMELEGEVAYEGGADNWSVRCACGARDDDGERMVACDICEVWQHTKCSGIEDAEAVPPLFVCGECCDSLVPPRYESLWFGSEEENNDTVNEHLLFV